MDDKERIAQLEAENEKLWEHITKLRGVIAPMLPGYWQTKASREAEKEVSSSTDVT